MYLILQNVMYIHVGITNVYEHIFIFTAPICLAFKINGRDRSSVTLAQDENTTFIANADQNNDAVNTAGLYSWAELVLLNSSNQSHSRYMF